MAVVTIHKLLAAANALLSPEAFDDYCPNGLQVEGRLEVRKLVSGVTASQCMVDAACQAGADALLVHHGYFWRGENPSIVGYKRNRIKGLLDSEISLLAYHLPLDAHPEFGNNAQLALKLGIHQTGGLQPESANPIGNTGVLSEPESLQQFGIRVAKALGREPQLVSGGDHPIRSIAWCTGGAQGYIEQAAQLGVDAYLSGEISEQTTHLARELGVHYIAAGHHATERYGAAAIGEHLAGLFGIEHQFIDIDNPA